MKPSKRHISIWISATVVLAFSLVAILFNFKNTPTSAQIESIGLHALNTHDQSSIDALLTWSKQGVPVAQRELGLVFSASPAMSSEAIYWLTQASIAGDVSAQFELAEANYKGILGLQKNDAQAWKWYASAAEKNNAKASFILARMAKYGEGVPRDLKASVGWLKQASHQGNAQAMFLLSNAYAAGEGINQDQLLAREWLERSAEGDYSVAIHALALSLAEGEKISADNPLTARHLLKEATDERTMHWNKYQ